MFAAAVTGEPNSQYILLASPPSLDTYTTTSASCPDVKADGLPVL